jgi:hypothetical protein
MEKYYLYGLQRSGTNVIQSFLLDNYNIEFSNNCDKSCCAHKHFRIYDNKNFIPITNVPNQYHNEYYINNLRDLDELLGDDNHTNKYIIVYKDIFSWLPSICKWARSNKWVYTEKKDFINDYLYFLKKWYKIRNNRVLFISYEEYLNFYLNKNQSFVTKLNKFFKVHKDHNDIQKFYDKVTCSPSFDKTKLLYYIDKEYMKKYTEHEIHKIKNHNLYKKLNIKL